MDHFAYGTSKTLALSYSSSRTPESFCCIVELLVYEQGKWLDFSNRQNINALFQHSFHHAHNYAMEVEIADQLGMLMRLLDLDCT